MNGKYAKKLLSFSAPAQCTSRTQPCLHLHFLHTDHHCDFLVVVIERARVCSMHAHLNTLELESFSMLYRTGAQKMKGLRGCSRVYQPIPDSKLCWSKFCFSHKDLAYPGEQGTAGLVQKTKKLLRKMIPLMVLWNSLLLMALLVLSWHAKPDWGLK